MVNRRDKITIDERLCIGCEQCVKRCQGGALEMVDGKAQLTNEDYCDGLGVCLGECPVGAITVEKVEVESAPKPSFAGLKIVPKVDKQRAQESADAAHNSATSEVVSHLTHWPIQLHLISHASEYLKGADLLVAADCSAFACADFHETMLKGRKLVIACPKLDNNKEVYIQKLKGLIDNAMINSITVAIMEVPCCNALMQISKSAVDRSIRKVPIKRVVIGIRGAILSEGWI